jgi:hypothetical protein
MIGAWRLMFLPLGLAVQASAISHVRLQASAISHVRLQASAIFYQGISP